MNCEEQKSAQYLQLSDCLKRASGQDFERHRHPAVLLDRMSGLDLRVWGWWAGDGEVPCLLWAGDLGWGAAMVLPDDFDSEGYGRAFWSHRIKLLDLALANALGPARSLEDLELKVASDVSYGLDVSSSGLKGGLLWGIVQLRAARAQRGRLTARRLREIAVPEPAGEANFRDEELARHRLLPTVPKRRVMSASADLLIGRLGPRPISVPIQEISNSRN